MVDLEKYRKLLSQLQDLRRANLSPILFNKSDFRTDKQKFLSVLRFNDISVTMQIARMNLLHLMKEEREWEQYVFALNALLWYNICDDYICQYFYLLEHAEEITNLNYSQFLGKLKFKTLENLRNNHPCLSKLNSDLTSLHKCVNTIKHRLPILDRSKQNQSIGVCHIRPDASSPIGFSFDDESLLSTNVTNKESYTIEDLLDILFRADKTLTTFVNEFIYTQFVN